MNLIGEMTTTFYFTHRNYTQFKLAHNYADADFEAKRLSSSYHFCHFCFSIFRESIQAKLVSRFRKIDPETFPDPAKSQTC